MPKNLKYSEAEALRDMEHVIQRFKATMRELEAKRAALVKRIADRKDKEEAERARRRIKSKI